MITINFKYLNSDYSYIADDINDIEDSYNVYKQAYDLPNITVKTDKYNAIITAPYKMSIESDKYNVPVNNNYAVCIQSKSIKTVGLNNGIYLATVSISKDYEIDYKFDLLSVIYSDMTMTIANIYNNIYNLTGTAINVTSATSFDFKWFYDLNNIYMIYIDHNVTTCPHLFTPKYFADDFDYFDQYLTEGNTYTQSVNLTWLDEMNAGTRVSKVNPQLNSVDGNTVFTPPVNIIDKTDYSFVTPQGKYIDFKLINGTPSAELKTAIDYIDNMYTVNDLDNIVNEFNKNCRQEFGTRVYVYYKGKRYNNLSLAYDQLLIDIYSDLCYMYNSGFENLSLIQKQKVLKSYMCMNKAFILLSNLLDDFDMMDDDEIERNIIDISNTIKIGLMSVNSFNICDVFNSFDNFTYNLNKLYSKVTSRDINIDFEFWNI